MLITKYVKVEITGYNIKYYKSKGYDNISKGNIIDIPIESLYQNALNIVDVQCDYCGEVFQRRYADYISSKKRTIQKDACKRCVGLKRKEVCQIKYGVDNPAQLQSVQEKMKETNMERYGCENAFQNKVAQDKFKNTMMKNYGVKYSMQSKEILAKSEQTCLNKYGNKCYLRSNDGIEKSKATCLEKYGVDHVAASGEIQKRIRNTMRERYGVDYPLQNSEILARTLDSQISKDGVYTSAGQRYLHELYGGEENVRIGVFVTDIYFPEQRIVCEYDGGGHRLQIDFGHMTESEFSEKEERRERFIISKGNKIFRIINPKDTSISDDLLLNIKGKAFDILLNSSYNVYTYNILTKEEQYR